VVAGKGAINPYKRLCGRVWGLPPPMFAKGTRWQEEYATGAANGIVLPPIVGRGWVGEDQVGKKGRAELGDGIAAAVVAGKGAIDPYKQSCGHVWGLPLPMLAKGTRWREEYAAGAADGIVLPCWW
jgi:hypothetical protein